MSKQRNQSTNFLLSDEKEFTNSCCDYQSDIFKEQPSQLEFSRLAEERQFINLESDDDCGMSENFIVSPLHNKTPITTFIDPNNSLRVNISNGKHFNYQGSKLNQLSLTPHGYNSQTVLHVVKQNQSKLSCEQSLILGNQQNCQSNNITAIAQSTKNKKQPFSTLIPQNINKNLSKDFNSVTKSQKPFKIQMLNNKEKSRQDQKVGLNSRTVNNENINVMLCEESELITMMKGGSKIQEVNASHNNLTPQKHYPVPMSPSSKPILSNNSSSINNQNRGGNFTQQNNYYKSSKNYNNSDQKRTVVYNEFKYFTSSNEINQTNLKNFIHITNNGIQRKSDIVSPHYELSPCDSKIFDISSPKNSVSGNPNQNIRANSLRKQILVGLANNHIQDNRNYQLQLKHLDSSQSGKSDVTNQNLQNEIKIKELQDYIQQLEEDLKESKVKNDEIQKKMKEKSFIQSFDKTCKGTKHLSDTEDSLILSEKKNFKRTSHSNSKNQNIPNHSSSSIVDVKIRPISNLKGPFNRKNSASSNKQDSDCHQPTDDTQEPIAEMEYQVQTYNDNNQNIHQEQDYEEYEGEQEDECEGCERLKQLVFQAKEAIDDLKAEIEEWRDICGEKEAELRTLQHKLYNDIVGVDKKFQVREEENMVKEYDPTRPSTSIESKKVRNFIQHNKKKIKSRSKTRQSSERKSIPSRRTTLKNMKDIVPSGTDEDLQFYEAEDQCIQTSFAQDQITLSQNNTSRIDPTQQCRSALKLNYYVSNASTSQNLSPERQNDDVSILNQNQVNQEELQDLRTKTQQYEQEIGKLKGYLQQVTKQCENFMQVYNKVKKNKGAKKQNVDIEQLKQQYQIVSPLESYSILEKISEWKREEGLSNNEDQELTHTKIPRPTKLIMEITQEELLSNNLKTQEEVESNPMNDFKNYIKQEQENLKKQQELKFKELQKQQNEYLHFLKGQQ